MYVLQVYWSVTASSESPCHHCPNTFSLCRYPPTPPFLSICLSALIVIICFVDSVTMFLSRLPSFLLLTCFLCHLLPSPFFLQFVTHLWILALLWMLSHLSHSPFFSSFSLFSLSLCVRHSSLQLHHTHSHHSSVPAIFFGEKRPAVLMHSQMSARNWIAF